MTSLKNSVDVAKEVWHPKQMDLWNRSSLLATGVRAPLLNVAITLNALGTLLNGPPTDRQIVADLRRVCVEDSRFEGEVLARMQAEGFAERDGSVVPVVRTVVLASIRGEAKGLTLVSPFVEDLDRTLSDLIRVREDIRAIYSQQEAEQLLLDTVQQLPKTSGRTEGDSWAKSLMRQGFVDGRIPPPSRN
jgi:hypothetical protein